MRALPDSPESTLPGRWLRSRTLSLVCAGAVILAAVLPPEGIPFPLCQFRRLTHLPCPGCGLSRSFIGMAHLDAARAGFYHPAGLLLFPAALFMAALLLVPERSRASLADAAGTLWLRHPRLRTGGAIVLGALFVLYGLGRIAWVLASGRPSPW